MASYLNKQFNKSNSLSYTFGVGVQEIGITGFAYDFRHRMGYAPNITLSSSLDTVRVELVNNYSYMYSFNNCFYEIYVNGQLVHTTQGHSGTLTFNVVASETLNEIITPQIDSGIYGNSSWRNRLHTGIPKSNLKVEYETVGTPSYELRLNGSKIADLNDWRLFKVQYDISKTECMFSYDMPEVTTFDETGTYQFGISGMNIENGIFYNATNSRCGHQISASFNNGQLSGNMPLSFTWERTKWATWNVGYTASASIPNISNRQFTEKNFSWTGASNTRQMSNLGDATVKVKVITDRLFQYNNSSVTYDINHATGDPSGTETEVNFNNGHDFLFPTDFGNVTTATPNQYTEKSTYDAHYKEKCDEGFDESTCVDCTHTELRIVPPICGTDASNNNCNHRRNLLLVQGKAFTDNSQWYGYNATVSGNVATATGEGAYIYQNYYRDKYGGEQDDNNILVNTDYRQRHSTHLRFLQNNGFSYTDNSTYDCQIQLVYKATNNQDGHIWTVKYNSNTNCYDLLRANGSGYGNTDCCFGTIMPENYKLYNEGAERTDPSWGVTYIEELANISVGWLPNICGQLRVLIPNGKSINIGTLQSVLSPSINQVMSHSGTEYQPLEYVGDHNPKPEGQEADSFICYLGRVSTVAVNGARCGDIPDYRKVRNPHRLMNTESLPINVRSLQTTSGKSLSDGFSIIYPKDDIGELSLNVANASIVGYRTDGTTPLYDASSMYDNQFIYSSWFVNAIKKDSGGNVIDRMLCCMPQFDTVSCDDYENFNSFLSVGNFYVWNSFGGEYDGIDDYVGWVESPNGKITENTNFLTATNTDILNMDSLGAYGDNNEESPKLVIQNGGYSYCYEVERRHGHISTEYISSGNRLFNKVKDGVKYLFSYIYPEAVIGFIWRNSQGNILRNSQNKILRGHGYDNNP